MADAQFVVYNDAGIEQVSFNGINLSFISKRTIAMADWTTGSLPRSKGLSYSFSVTAKAPIIAVATSAAGQSGAVYVQVSQTGADTWDVYLFGAASTPTPSIAGAPTLNATTTVYVFDMAPAPTTGPGLALFAADGTCTFNAAYPFARVVGMVGTTDNYYGYPDTMAVPAGKTYALMQRSCWGQMYTEVYNSMTGDRLVFDWRMAGSGGAGTSIDMGRGYSCAYVQGGGISTKAGTGGVGAAWFTNGYGCNPSGTATGYMNDAVVLDVTGL